MLDVTMDDTLSLASHTPVLHAIIEDCNEHWRICFKPDIAGIIVEEPKLISKAIVTNLCPSLVEAWETQQEQQRSEAQRIEQRFIAFMRRFNDNGPMLSIPQPPELGVACDQHLLPDRMRHWGELRICARHPTDKAPFKVCKGCRVHHQMQLSTSRDQQIVATRGARVPVCADCATQTIRLYGVGHQGCMCDSQWTCYRCREADLVKLARVRTDRHTEGKCGRCLRVGELATNIDFCVHCEGFRVHAEPSEQTRP